MNITNFNFSLKDKCLIQYTLIFTWFMQLLNVLIFILMKSLKYNTYIHERFKILICHTLLHRLFKILDKKNFASKRLYLKTGLTLRWVDLCNEHRSLRHLAFFFPITVSTEERVRTIFLFRRAHREIWDSMGVSSPGGKIGIRLGWIRSSVKAQQGFLRSENETYFLRMSSRLRELAFSDDFRLYRERGALN